MRPEVVLVTVSPRVAPGQLSWPAWQALRDAAVVVLGPGAEGHAEALTGAGVEARAAGAAPLPDGPLAVLVDAERVGQVRDGLGDRDVRVVPGVAELPGSRLLDLVALMDRLRGPGGCPWDAEQTHASLVQYLVEEAYEVIDAIELDDPEALQEELGDLLLQVVFHARISAERPDGPSTIDDVAAGIVDKLVRRHPHVFAPADEAAAPAAAHTERGWDAIKRAEKGRASAVDGVPMGQPALLLAAKLVGRVERAGLQVPLADSAEVSDEVAAGDALLGLVAELRRAGVDPEAALRAAVRRYAERVREVERA
ncbi:XTP/dITP diphosphohydrolase [Motilibacter peucedani]|uniref:XTP/dITP diphosphohydrolase n=1 Tax=Motilibacter peucedani TaxID=598650 RepID=A0A420XKH5_9ACTN|nr:MazG family protein [Motilibacter peucedani]RKS68622.1 XTP/dITP diphosphohydrolase [Motilibacter peucedani]